ncbi:ATP--guanido phosphotransferase [Peptoniphilus catoniae]|uniref:ATP--guanido phosphotransferase n=1 Tax=Peptoniphilus catoniae TaxID=1660341 RepID=UPI0010FE48BA|nr:ATP--guanido phosphotransferase [Peptoniphilus catoniae]
MSIILYNELELRRNISGFNFPGKLDQESSIKILERLKSILEPQGFIDYRTKNMTSLDKLKFYEEGFVTAEIFRNEGKSAIFKRNDDLIRVNGEDHIEIYRYTKGQDLKGPYEKINSLDDFLDSKLDYAFREDFGYLTSNPNICGNAFIAKVYMHLPATGYFGDMSLVSTLNRLGYKVSALGSPERNNRGVIYKISLDRTIGIGEEEYLDKISNIVREVADMEEQNRRKLYLDKIIDLEDLVNRAYGILRNCRVIKEDEMIYRMSDLFLGIELSILKPKVNLDLMDSIKRLKNGYLQVERGALLDEKSRDILRANKVRKMMKEVF